jgi:hypothetical protein
MRFRFRSQTGIGPSIKSSADDLRLLRLGFSRSSCSVRSSTLQLSNAATKYVSDEAAFKVRQAVGDEWKVATPLTEKTTSHGVEARGEQSERSIPDPIWHSMSAPRGG